MEIEPKLYRSGKYLGILGARLVAVHKGLSNAAACTGGEYLPIQPHLTSNWATLIN